MRMLFLMIAALVPAAAVLCIRPDAAFFLALSMAAAEAGSLFAPEMYYVSAAAELNDAHRKGLWHMAWLLMLVGIALAWLAADMRCIAAAVYGLARLMIEHRIVGGAQEKARPIVDVSLLRALPEALLLRGLYILPAAGLLAYLYFGMGVNTVLPYAAGLLLYGLIRVYNEPRGAEAERFGARWCIAALATALTGFVGVFGAVYCAWAALGALLPVQRNARAWLCALIVLLQAALGAAGAHFGMVYITIIAAVLCLPVLFVQKAALYAAYLPLRARHIRRRAGR